MPTVGDEMGDWFAAVAAQQAEALEQVCEQAIQSGTCGVSVRRWWDGTSAQMVCRVDPAVPYGLIQEHGVA